MAKIILDKNGLAKTSGTLTVFNYDAESGEFTGATDEYLPQGVGVPANACSSAPPSVDAGFVAIYQQGAWQVVADHRGETIYSTLDGAVIEIRSPGDYPTGTTPLAPATVFDKWDGEEWVTDTDALQAATIRIAEAEKTARIVEANNVTQLWQTQLLLGVITDADKVSLTAWMKYAQAVQSLDTGIVQDITWPEKPGS